MVDGLTAGTPPSSRSRDTKSRTNIENPAVCVFTMLQRELVSDSQCKRSASSLSQNSVMRSVRDVSLAGLNALSFLLGFDTVGSVTGKSSGL